MGRTPRGSRAPSGSTARERPPPARVAARRAHVGRRSSAAVREAGHEPLAPRLYGRGPSIDGWAAQLLGEVEGPFVAVGASMGGYCALALARRASERVPGLVLVGSRAGADTAERRAFRDEQVARLRAEGVPAELETDVPAEDLAVAQEAMRDRPDLTSVVASFGGPLLVCVGDGDEIVSGRRGARARRERAPRLAGGVRGRGAPAERSSSPSGSTPCSLEFLAQWDVTLDELSGRLARRVSRSSTCARRSSTTGPRAHTATLGTVTFRARGTCQLEELLACRSADEVPHARRAARGRGGRRLLPRREPVGIRRAGAARSGVRRTELRRVLARVVSRPFAARGAGLAQPERGTRRRGCGPARSSARSARPPRRGSHRVRRGARPRPPRPRLRSIGSVTSAWNWIPHAFRRRKACVRALAARELGACRRGRRRCSGATGTRRPDAGACRAPGRPVPRA